MLTLRFSYCTRPHKILKFENSYIYGQSDLTLIIFALIKFISNTLKAHVERIRVVKYHLLYKNIDVGLLPLIVKFEKRLYTISIVSM